MRKITLYAFLAASLSLTSLAVAAPISKKIDSSLNYAFSGKRQMQPVKVIIFLSEQPGPEIGKRVRAEWEPRIEAVASHLRAISALRRPNETLTKAEEMRLIAQMGVRPMSETEMGLAFELDALTNNMIRAIATELNEAVKPEQDQVTELIESNGGVVTDRLSAVSGLVAIVPAASLHALAQDSRIALISNDNPGRAELSVSVPTIGAPTFWAGGIRGGAFDAGVLDTGVQQNHAAFAGKLFEAQNGQTTDSNGHGTSMAGIMAGNDATNRGVAYEVGTICVATAGTDATSMVGMNFLATQTIQSPEAVNYSFGNGTASTNDYAPIDQFFDAVIDTFGYMVAKSTGNGGFGSGSPTITHPAPAFNLMASANMDDRNTLDRLDDRINSSSSRGPTATGRKKPDITSPGTSIVSPNRTGGFTGVTGTSPASPHTGASIILLKHAGVTDIRAAKAILLNNTDAINDAGTSATTDDTWVAGSLWNRRYGWGYINLTKAFAHVTDYFVHDFAAPPTGGRRFKLYKGSMLTNDKATLVWQRHATFNGSTYPTLVEGLSNLDLKGFNALTNAIAGQSVSAIDNVEQFSVGADTSMVLKVYTVGAFDPQVTSERFGLATEEGFTVANGPAFSTVVNQTGDFVPGSQGTAQIAVTNTGDVPAHNVLVSFNNMPTVGPNTQNAGTILPGQTKFVNFTIQIPNVAGDFLVLANISSDSYEETFTHVGEGAIEVR